MALRKAYMRTLVRRNPDCRNNQASRGRGLSQTSGTYVTSHSVDGDIPGRTTFRLQKLAAKTRTDSMAVNF